MTETNSRNEVLRREALAWIARIGLGEATEDDLVSLRRWRDSSPEHAAALAWAGRLWRGLEAVARSGDIAVSMSRKPVDHRPSRRALLGGAAAAAAAAAGIMVVWPPLHLWPSLAELGADYRTITGEQRHVTVADSVSVEMNTQTSIAARTADGAPGFELIAGEVAVTIAPATPSQFVVTAADGRITAHHATFNLRRDGSMVSVTCIDGEVKIECERRMLTLGRARQVSYDGLGLGEIVAVDPATVVAWRDGMLVFHDTPLTRVIDEVNRYRAGRIILIDAALGHQLVTARFEINRLDTVMSQIRHVFRVPVKTLPGGIVLVG